MLSVALTGWYTGFAFASLVIAVVVTMVAWIMNLLGHISTQAEKIGAQLELARQATAVIDGVPEVNAGLKDIAESCITARGVLEGAFG